SPRSRNTRWAASRMRASTSPACSSGGRPTRATRRLPPVRRSPAAGFAIACAFTLLRSLHHAAAEAASPLDLGPSRVQVKRTILYRSYFLPFFPPGGAARASIWTAHSCRWLEPAHDTEDARSQPTRDLAAGVSRIAAGTARIAGRGR